MNCPKLQILDDGVATETFEATIVNKKQNLKSESLEDNSILKRFAKLGLNSVELV
jgi:hypothetical protein